MNGTTPVPYLAVFADYENVAIGARDAGLSLDIGLIMTRLFDRGTVVLKRAYCDWSRYHKAKKPLHEAGFELVEVPHVSYGGKNSADIRLAVDAIDLCHTKPHFGMYAIISGDSDFSPLVAKLRENSKSVIGIGVKASTSKLLVEGCDEFVYYDDLARETGGGPSTGDPGEAHTLLAETARRLLKDRGEPVWASHVKQVIKRSKPHFDEGHFGYRSFNQLVEGARDVGLVKVRRDEPSGGYVVLSAG